MRQQRRTAGPGQPDRVRTGALLAVAVVAILAATGGLMLLRGRLHSPATTAMAPTAVSGAGAARAEVDVGTLLDRRSTAVLQRDRAGFLATVDGAQPDFAARQAALFDALAGVPVASWSYRLDPASPNTVPADRLSSYDAPAWAPVVVLTYSLRGFDETPAVENQGLTFVHRPAGWVLGSDSDFDGTARGTARGLWDFGPVIADRGSRTLVLGHPAARPALAAIAAEVDADIPAVSRVWGEWAAAAVIVVPADQVEFGRITGQTGNVSQIVALATAEPREVAGHRDAVGNRVVVNLANFDRLSAAGRRVVVTHELTHVASRSSTGRETPTWLVEGLADYVGYLGAGVDSSGAAQELVGEVRSGQVPAELPADAEFDSASPRLAAAYEQAWLACRMIVERTDEASLLRFYRAVGMSTASTPDEAVAQALRAELHTTTESFTATWRTYLQAQLG